MSEFKTLARVFCRTSDLPLWARIDGDKVVGISNNHVTDDERPEGATWRDVPLLGDDKPYDPVREVCQTSYIVGNDRVVRVEKIRDKTATELLGEISWWWRAMHSAGHLPSIDEAGAMSPSAVNDSARAMMAAQAGSA